MQNILGWTIQKCVAISQFMVNAIVKGSLLNTTVQIMRENFKCNIMFLGALAS